MSKEKTAIEKIIKDSGKREVMIHGSFTTRREKGSKKTEEQKEVSYVTCLAY
jgi:hypothetical protein